MAQMALGVIGGVVGGMVGGPMGAQIGYALGSAIGGALDPQKVYGSRLTDLKATTSNTGVAIPYVFGQNRLSGNVIFAAPLKEVENDGGKGGSSVQQVTYSYYGNFAVGIAYGEVDELVAIKLNNTTWFTNDENASYQDLSASMKQGGSFTFYRGTKTQKPDATIQSYAGISKTSAYKGFSYVVFKDLPLEKFGNRLPNVECIVKRNGQFYLVTHNAYKVPDTFNGVHSVSNTCFPSFNQTKQQVYIQYFQNQADYNAGKQLSASATILEDNTVIINNSFGYYFNEMNDITFSSQSKSTDGSILMVGREKVTYKWKYYCAFKDGQATNLDAFCPDNNNNSFNYGLSDCLSVKDDTHLFMSSYNVGTSSTYRQSITQVVFSGKTAVSSKTITPSFRCSSLAIGVNYLFVLDHLGNIHRYDLELNYVDLYFSQDGTGFIDLTSDGDELYSVNGVRNFYKISKDTKTLLNQASAGTIFDKITFKNGSFFGVNSTPISKTVNYINRTTKTEDIQVASVVAEICQLAGLKTTEYDVGELTKDFLRGYILSNNQTGRTALQSLCDTFFFDIVDTSKKLKFIKRGKQPLVTIPEDDYVVTEGQEDHITVTFADILTLPYKVNISFFDYDNDFQISSQPARRHTVESQNVSSIQVAISVNSSKARQMANAILYIAYNESTSFQFSLPHKYFWLEVGDSVTIMKNNIDYIARIKEINYQNDVMIISAVEDDPSIYTQNIVGGKVDYNLTNTISVNTPSRLELLDIPLLRDQDDNVGIYLSVGGYNSNNWKGAQVYKSNDKGQSWLAWGTSKTRAGIIGDCLTTLGDFKAGYIPDEQNTLLVKVNGVLSSTTMDNVKNGINIAMVGNEMIGYREATLKAENTYLLSGLLRGLQGTEREISNHTFNERFVVALPSTLYLENYNLSEIEAPRQFKAASFGELLTDAFVKDFTYEAVALKPYAPVHIGGGRDSDNNLLIKWVRRTRTNGSWKNGTDVPLGETLEAYSIDILKDGLVIRTIDSTVQNAQYTATQQIADFGSVQSSINVVIYQISSSVGRGFGASATI